MVGLSPMLDTAAIHAPPLSPADHIDARDWDKTQAVNVTATARLIAMVAPLLTAGGQPSAHSATAIWTIRPARSAR